MSLRGSRAGKYRQVIQIEQKVKTGRDTMGGVVEEWQPLHIDLRADVNPGRGREFEAEKQRHNALTHLISIRMIPGIQPHLYNHHRVILGPAADIAEEYEGARILRVIATTIKDETNREILLACTEDQ